MPFDSMLVNHARKYLTFWGVLNLQLDLRFVRISTSSVMLILPFSATVWISRSYAKSDSQILMNAY